MAGERRVAIVTGAASGIGRAMTLGLLEGGIDVAAVDKEAAWLDELASTAGGKAFIGRLRPVRADLSDPVAFEQVVSAVMDASDGSTSWSTMPVSGRARSEPTSGTTRFASGRSRPSNGIAFWRLTRPRP
jgi:NAD(P)-dependent dehydrogenase (short-subunit alcohol dehydrogenase family)